MQTDPYRYFRIEARDLLEALTRGALELEKGQAGKDVVGRLLRHAHTLKGAARIVQQQRISELSHEIEGLLTPHRETGAVARQQINELLALIDEINSLVRGVEEAPAELTDAAATPDRVHLVGSDAVFNTVHVEIGELDKLLHDLSELAVHIGAIRNRVSDPSVLSSSEHTAGLAGREGSSPGGVRGNPVVALAERASSAAAVQRLLAAAVEKAGRELDAARHRVQQMRLLPAEAMFANLERVARDGAQSVGKRIEFVSAGGESRLEAHVLRGIQAALVQLVNNAIAHGIESPDERQELGKPRAGRIEIRAQPRGNRVAFICQDDGRGINVEDVRRAAIYRGVAADVAARLNVQEAFELLLTGGMTTAPALTPLAGRGIGLDIVREAVARLQGEIAVSSDPGRGARVEIVVPLSLESLDVLEVEANGAVVSIPFDALVSAVRVGNGEVERSAHGESIQHEGRTIPFAHLAGLLRPGTSRAMSAHPLPVLVLRAGSQLVALGVDRFRGVTRIMRQPLPEVLGSVELIAGAAFDSEGNPQPMLDPGGLVRAVQRGDGLTAEQVVGAWPPLLVVDDSLTTRMLEQSILETAGYEVDLAASGEEALARARRRRYGLFIVDVEMPGMDGFEFIERVQSDPGLKAIPSILVTSRSSPEDRRRGQQVGARAYIVKSDFDEAQLLRTIRGLIG